MKELTASKVLKKSKNIKFMYSCLNDKCFICNEELPKIGKGYVCSFWDLELDGDRIEVSGTCLKCLNKWEEERNPVEVYKISERTYKTLRGLVKIT